jgi:hypothetical protein
MPVLKPRSSAKAPIPQNWPFPIGLQHGSVNRRDIEFEARMFGSPPWTRFELMCHKLTCARTDESPLPEPPADLKQTLVLLGRPVRTRLELHPEQASRTKLAKLCGHTTWTRFGLGRRQGQSMAEEWEFHAQSAGYLFFTCSLLTMAPAVASHGLCVAFPHDHSTHAENWTATFSSPVW